MKDYKVAATFIDSNGRGRVEGFAWVPARTPEEAEIQADVLTPADLFEITVLANDLGDLLAKNFMADYEIYSEVVGDAEVAA